MLEDIPDSPSRRAYLALVQTHEALSAQFAALFRAHGLTAAQFNVLRTLIQGDPGGLRCGEIASGLIHRVPDVTRLLDRMERQGLVARRRSERDRRAVLTRLTAKGAQLCRRLYRPLAELHAAQFRMLSNAELSLLEDYLDRSRWSAREKA